MVSQGTFIVIYPPTKKLAALRPMVPKFPDLRCSVVGGADSADPWRRAELHDLRRWWLHRIHSQIRPVRAIEPFRLSFG